MGVEQVVFRSKSERRNFYKLHRTWAKQYPIYHNLPFLNVFNPGQLQDWSDPWSPVPFELSDREFNLLKKTSIDYTLCDSDDKPLVCIEFDGLQDGFNVGADYFADQLVQGPLPSRQYMMELKLKVAHGSLFPYFVVGSDYFNDLPLDLKLTVIDGIIGDVLANRAKRKRFAEGLDPQELGYTHEEWDLLDSDLKQFYVEDWVLGIEIDLELEFNPVARARMKLSQDLGIFSWGEEFMTYPETSASANPAERNRFFNNALKYGRKVTLHTDEFGSVTGTAWISNFRAWGYSGLGLLEDLAFIAALAKLKRLKDKRRS